VNGKRGNIIYIQKVLDESGLVPAYVFIDGVNLFFGGVLAEHHPGRVARKDVEQKKDNGDNAPHYQESVK